MGHVALLPSHVLLALLQPDVDTTDALSSMSSASTTVLRGFIQILEMVNSKRKSMKK